MTQEQACETLHMSSENLGKIERGMVPYDQYLLEAAADLYSCTTADLLVRDPTQKEQIWSIWEQAKQGEREQISEYAEFIITKRTGTDN